MQPLYVFIASQCQKESEHFGLADSVAKLKDWVLHNQSLIKFDAFEYPYYVKKHLNWQYRLLVRLDDITHHGQNFRILSFIKLYHRGDKEYEKIWINTKIQCDPIFDARIGLSELQNFVIQLSNSKKISYIGIHPILRLVDYRVDTLNLAKTYSEFYYESPVWRYEIAPKLSVQHLKQSYQCLIKAWEQQKNISIDFDNTHIGTNEPPFKKYLPFIYHQNITAYFEKPPYVLNSSTNDTQDTFYYRKIPLDFILKEELWTISQTTQLPIELNQFQRQCITALCTEQKDYPLVIKSPKNFGNSTLLALLYVHFYFKKPMDNVLNCLFLCQHHETSQLRTSIKNHIKLYQQWHNLPKNHLENIDEILEKSCLSFQHYLYQHLSDEDKQIYHQDKHIDYIKFSQLYYKKYHNQSSKQYKKNTQDIDKYFHSYFVWNVIRYIISEKEDKGNKRKNTTFIDNKTIEFIYENIYQSWYVKLKEKEHYWDDLDLIKHIEEHDIELNLYSVLLCDDSHLLPPRALAILLKQNIWLQQGNGLSLSQIPLIFAYHQAAVKGVYDWQNYLYQILNQLITLNQQHSKELTHISELIDNTETNNCINHLFYHYHKLNHSFNINDDIHKIPNSQKSNLKVIFVPPTKDNITLLLKQHHIPLIINDAHHHLIETVCHQTAIYNVYRLPLDKTPRLFYSVSNLPNKSDAIALFGFESLIENMVQNLHRINELNHKERYYLSAQIHFLHTVINHSLQTIFIVGKHQDDITVWKKFFSSFIDIEYVNQEHLSLYQTPHNNPFPKRTLQDYLFDIKSKKNIDIKEIRYHINFYKNNFNIDEYFYFVSLSHYLKKDIDGFFCQYTHHQHKEYMLTLLILLNDLTHLNKYKSLIPKKLRAHILCLQLANDEIFLPTWLDDYESMVKYATADNQFWAKFWHDCHKKLSMKIYNHQNFSKQDYARLHHANEQLKQKNCIYSEDLLAYLNHKLDNHQQAIDIWDKAYLKNHIKTYPNEYHQSQIQCLKDIGQRLDYILNFHTTFIIQELSKMNLNELQEAYWQKILDSLKEDELEPVLIHILPYLDSQEILEKLYQFCQKTDKEHEESLSHRILQFKALNMCLSDAWQDIQARIEFYQPTKCTSYDLHQKLAHNFRVTTPKQTNKQKDRYSIPDELKIILHGLCNNNQLRKLSQNDNFISYQKQETIIAMFESLQNYFSNAANQNIRVWKTNFDNIKVLCQLMEYSPDLSMPLSLYDNAIAQSSPKDTLYPFFVERLWVIIQKIHSVAADNEELISKSNLIEQRYKHPLKNLNTNNICTQISIQKSVSDIMQSILKLTPAEHQLIQKLQREEREKAEQEKAHQAAERLEKERLEKERLEKERLEKERLEKERLEKERLEKERLEKERLEREKAEQERLAQKQLEKEHQEEHLVQEKLEQEKAQLEDTKPEQEHQEAKCVEKERLTQSSHQPTPQKEQTLLTQPSPPTVIAKPKPRHATSEFVLFGLRVFVSRTHQRINIEDTLTGERWSLHHPSQSVQSDWQYTTQDNTYHIGHLQLIITYATDGLHLEHSEHGIGVYIHL